MKSVIIKKLTMKPYQRLYFKTHRFKDIFEDHPAMQQFAYDDIMFDEFMVLKPIERSEIKPQYFNA